MALETLTITITDPRLIDGWVEAANRNGVTPEALATEFIENQGRSYAELFGVGVITSSAFIRRFTATEYGTILAAAEQSPEVAALIDQLTESPKIAMDDPRLAPGLELLAGAGLIEVERIEELLTYSRPEVQVQASVVVEPEPEVAVEPEAPVQELEPPAEEPVIEE
jgi:hypothetical protein